VSALCCHSSHACTLLDSDFTSEGSTSKVEHVSYSCTDVLCAAQAHTGQAWHWKTSARQAGDSVDEESGLDSTASWTEQPEPARATLPHTRGGAWPCRCLRSQRTHAQQNARRDDQKENVCELYYGGTPGTFECYQKVGMTGERWIIRNGVQFLVLCVFEKKCIITVFLISLLKLKTSL